MALEEHRPREGKTTKLCRRCSSMTSTLAGFTALISDGYIHYDRKSLEKSANRGCKCCTLLGAESEKLWWDLEEGHNLNIWAELPKDHIQHKARGTYAGTYPLKARSLVKFTVPSE